MPEVGDAADQHHGDPQFWSEPNDPQGRADLDAYHAFIELGFRSALSRRYLDDYSKFAYGALRSQLQTGEIFSRSAILGRPVARQGYGWLEVETIHEIVVEMIARGTELFKSAITQRKWCAEQASLQTYFINSCILCFPNAYRLSVSRSRSWQSYPVDTSELYGVLAEQRDFKRGPATEADDKDMINTLMKNIPPKLREILLYLSEGYSAREIGPLIGASDRAVESKIYRLRNHMKESMRSNTIAGQHPA